MIFNQVFFHISSELRLRYYLYRVLLFKSLLLHCSHAKTLTQDLVNTLPCTCYIVWLNTVQCGNEEWQSPGKMTNLERNPFPVNLAPPLLLQAWQPANIELFLCVMCVTFYAVFIFGKVSITITFDFHSYWKNFHISPR